MRLDETKPWRQGCQGPSFQANQLITLCACVWKVWLVGEYGEVVFSINLVFARVISFHIFGINPQPSMYKNMYLSYVLSTLANCVKSDPIYGQHT